MDRLHRMKQTDQRICQSEVQENRKLRQLLSEFLAGWPTDVLVFVLRRVLAVVLAVVLFWCLAVLSALLQGWGLI